MAFVTVDINKIKLDDNNVIPKLDASMLDESVLNGAPVALNMPTKLDLNQLQDMPINTGYSPVDINAIKLDAQPEAVQAPQVEPKIEQPRSLGQELGRQVGLTGRYAAEGLAGLADLPNMAYNYGIVKPVNALTPDMQPMPELQYPSQMTSQALTEAGVPQPENATERVVGDASRAIAGLGGTAGAASMIAKQAPKAASALSALTENLPMQARAAIGSSVASGTARENDVGALGQLAAGVLGGGLAAMPKRSVTTKLTSDDIKMAANQKYKQAEQLGGVIKPKTTNQFLGDIAKLTPQTTAGRLIGGDSPVTKIVERFGALKDRPLNLAEAQELDEFLGDAVTSSMEMGKATKQSIKLSEIQSSLRNTIENASASDIVGGKEGFAALKEGRKLWSKSSKLGDIERIIARAELMDNPATGIKSGFRTLASNPKRMRGFTLQERKMVKNAAESGVVADALRTFGSRLIPIITAGSGGGLGMSALSGAGATLSRKGAEALQMNKASALADLIAGNVKGKKNYTPTNLGTLQGLNALPKDKK